MIEEPSNLFPRENIAEFRRLMHAAAYDRFYAQAFWNVPIEKTAYFSGLTSISNLFLSPR